MSRLGGDFSDCIHAESRDATSNAFAEELPVKYSSAACYKTCYQKEVIRRCGCADPQYPISGAAFGDFNGLSCDIMNVTQGRASLFCVEKSLKILVGTFRRLYVLG